MLLFNQTSPGARTAIIYITLGALLLVWTGVWWLYVYNNPPATNHPYYWMTGSTGTGLTLLIIGFSLGRIGREARQADQPAAQGAANAPGLTGPAVTPMVMTAVPTAPVATAAPAVVPYPPGSPVATRPR